MTRKDYKKIAAAIASCRPKALESTTTRPQLSEGEDLWTEIVVAIDLVLAADNPRFQPSKFHAACFGDRPTNPFWWRTA